MMRAATAVMDAAICEHEIYCYVPTAWGRYVYSVGQICLRCGRQWDDAATGPYVSARKQRQSDKRWLGSSR